MSSNAKALAVLAILAIMIVVDIVAIQILGRNASSTFTSVGQLIGPAKPQAPPSLLAGFAETDITPSLKDKTVYMAGFGQNRKATAIHDPLKARAIVFKDGKSKIALVSIDVVGFFYPNVENVRGKLDGFPYVLVPSTHNHEGPDTLGICVANPFTSGTEPDYMNQV